jgi:phosphate transport system substrate-binding protein
MVFTGALLVLAGSALQGVNGGNRVQLSGAGATFPAPIYSKWFEEYHKLHPDVEIAYQPVGSGGGIRKLLDASIDFAGSDGPMTDEQLAGAKSRIVHLPTVLGAVVVVSNVNGGARALRFTPATLAGIYLGTISVWNDPQIVAANPGAGLPSDQIIVVHRSEGSGTTYVWTDYLSHVSDEWKQKVGRGLSVSWPVGLSAKGNEGVASLVKATPSSIGYVELAYAMQNSVEHAELQNASGKFVKATLASVTAAAASSAKELPQDFRVSIVNAPGGEAYPISSFTWLLVSSPITDESKRKALTDLLRWAISDGQKLVSGLSFAPLPEPVVEKEIQAIARLEADDHP